MRIRIYFPDGSSRVYNVDPYQFGSIDEIADYIAGELAREYCEARHITKRETYDRVKTGAKGWIYRHLLTEIADIYYRRQKK